MRLQSQKFASTLPMKRKYTFKDTEKTNESPPRALTLTVEEVNDMGNNSQILELAHYKSIGGVTQGLENLILTERSKQRSHCSSRRSSIRNRRL